MSPQYKVGDLVEYHPIGGGDANTSTSIGEIVKIMTETGPAGSITVQASDDEPRYDIVNQNTGKPAAYKEANIVGLAKQ